MTVHVHPIQLWAFASVQVGKSALWAGMDGLTLYVLIRVAHFPPDAAGTAFFASSLFSAVCDGAIGAIMVRASWALLILPILAGFAIATCALGFALLPVITPDIGFVGATAILMLVRGTYSLVDVSHNSLTGGFVQDEGHLSLARIRAVSTGCGALLIAALSVPLFADADHSHRLAGPILLAAASLAVLLMSPLPFLLHSTSREEAMRPVPARIERSLLGFYLIVVVGLAAVGTMAKALLHLEFAIANLMLCTLLIPTLARLAAVWLWPPVARRTGNARALAIALLVCGATSALAPQLIASGAIGTIMMMIIFGLGVGGIAMIFWAVLSERITALHPERHAGREAGIYGFFTMAVKIGLGMSGLIVGTWLSLEDRGVVPPAALASLSLIAALGCLAAAISVMPRHPRRMILR